MKATMSKIQIRYGRNAARRLDDVANVTESLDERNALTSLEMTGRGPFEE